MSKLDFKRFASQKNAETGSWLTLVDPWEDEVLTNDGKPCRVLLRGPTSKFIQSMLREKQLEEIQRRKAKKLKSKSSPDSVGSDEEDEEARVIEDVHLEMVSNAAPYILAFENVELDGKVLTAEDAEDFLNLTFPEMKQEGVDEQGKPKFVLANKPFAVQVAEHVKVGKNFLGNA